MRKQIVAGNWKMNTTVKEGVILSKEVASQAIPKGVSLVLGAPFTHLSEVKKVIGNTDIRLAAQNVSQHEEGAYTGEISASMLKSLGVDMVIIGHSERREYFSEAGEELYNKVRRALNEGIDVIFCVGEKLEEREAGIQNKVVEQQLKEGLFALDAAQMKNIVVAYEPVWAIGTGKTATPEQAQDIHASIRELVKKQFGESTSDNLSILYGGSCKPSNAQEIFAQKDIDGGLIGGAALKASDFMAIASSF